MYETCITIRAEHQTRFDIIIYVLKRYKGVEKLSTLISGCCCCIKTVSLINKSRWLKAEAKISRNLFLVASLLVVMCISSRFLTSRYLSLPFYERNFCRNVFVCCDLVIRFHSVLGCFERPKRSLSFSTVSQNTAETRFNPIIKIH